MGQLSSDNAGGGARSLLRTEAQARAAQLQVQQVRVELDLTEPAAELFDSRTTLEFTSSAEASFVDFQGRELLSVTLNGVPLDAARLVAGPHRADRAAAAEHARGARPDGVLERRRGSAPPRRPGGRPDLPLRHVVPGRRAALVRLLRPARPQGLLPLRRRRAAGVDGAGERPEHGDRTRPVVAQPAAAAVHLLRHPGRRAVRVGDGRARRHPPGFPRPRLAPRRARGRGPRPGDGDGPELRPLPPPLRGPVPVRGVPPGVRARLQRGRDGEPRLRHVPRQLHLPGPGHRDRARRPRLRGRPRDGSPVVRRPGHDALVGRSLAERVVRRVPGAPVLHRGHPLPAVDRVRDPAQGLGSDGRSGAQHPSGRRHRCGGRRGGPAGLRRDQLRQGRRRPQAARRLPRRRRVPGRPAVLLRPLRVRQRRVRRADRLLDRGRCCGPGAVGGRVAAQRRHGHARRDGHPAGPRRHRHRARWGTVAAGACGHRRRGERDRHGAAADGGGPARASAAAPGPRLRRAGAARRRGRDLGEGAVRAGRLGGGRRGPAGAAGRGCRRGRRQRHPGRRARRRAGRGAGARPAVRFRARPGLRGPGQRAAGLRRAGARGSVQPGRRAGRAVAACARGGPGPAAGGHPRVGPAAGRLPARRRLGVRPRAADRVVTG